MLSYLWSEKGRARLPLPNRPVAEWTIRLAELDDWAEELGRPLDLREPSEAVDEMLEEQRARTEDHDAELAPAFVRAARNYELLKVLCDAPAGREAVADDRLRAFVTWQLSWARRWAGWTWQHLEDASGAAAAMVMMAQGYFVAHRGGAGSSAALFPSREFLVELVRASGADGWLADQDVALPDWLAISD